MSNTPLSEQIRIVLYGIRNSGKSSLMNNIFEKEVSIVSEYAGTTTDPVTRSIEVGKLGPVSFTDTAGFDDIGVLGELRVKKTKDVIDIADIIIFISRIDTDFLTEELQFLNRLKNSKKKFLIALTFCDHKANENKIALLKDLEFIKINNITREGIHELKEKLIRMSDELEYEITPVEGLVKENDFVILVTPIDLAAPKGRLILPQVETIRDLLDKDCGVLIVKERELKYFYDSLTIKPKLVITDSQVFSKVSSDIPENQMLTSFSILFARKKGELSYFIQGIKQLSKVPPESKILILESCSHHRQADDIGTVKIPRLFKQLIQPKVDFVFSRVLPEEQDLKQYYMTITCAGCMITRNRMLKRLEILKKNGIFSVNYGLFLAWVNGLLPRALEPFEYEYNLYLEKE